MEGPGRQAALRLVGEVLFEGIGVIVGSITRGTLCYCCHGGQHHTRYALLLLSWQSAPHKIRFATAVMAVGVTQDGRFAVAVMAVGVLQVALCHLCASFSCLQSNFKLQLALFCLATGLEIKFGSGYLSYASVMLG
eukprot:1142431-Pelagomonas_calceolata.AAC.7